MRCSNVQCLYMFLRFYEDFYCLSCNNWIIITTSSSCKCAYLIRGFLLQVIRVSSKFSIPFLLPFPSFTGCFLLSETEAPYLLLFLFFFSGKCLLSFCAWKWGSGLPSTPYWSYPRQVEDRNSLENWDMHRLGQAVATKLLLDNRSGLLQCLLIVSLGEFRRSPEIHLLLCCCSPSQSPECVNGFSAADERSRRDKRGTRVLFSVALHVWLVFSGYHLALMLWHCAGGGFGRAVTKQHQLGEQWVLQCLSHFWAHEAEQAPVAAGWA